jgi:N-acetylglucosaminyldiphosphoundecaprenol N-acetyl-beta-D-mannosaminyltransferase
LPVPVSSPLPQIRFAGMPFNPLTVGETVRILAERPAAAPFAAYVTPNIEFIYLRRKNAEMRALFESALISTNDSRIVHRLARLAGLELRFAPGAYVVDQLFREVIRPDDAICVLGFTAEGMERIRAAFGLTNAFQYIPPMGFIRDEAAVGAAIEFVVAHPSRFILVAMGPPQSEQFCHRLMLDGRAKGVGLSIGSSLLVLSGQSNRAPDWMEHSGLVWLYRLIKEPGRLWRRYLVRGLAGVALCVADIFAWRLGLRRHIA